MTAPNFQTAYDAALQAMAASAARALHRKECEDPEVAGLVIAVFADGTTEVQLLNGQSIPVGGYTL